MRRKRRSPGRVTDPRLDAELAAVREAGARAHVPVRTCAGCGRRSPQALLRRFALDRDRRLEWRPRGGRGAYLHQGRECATRFLAGKPLVPALRARVDRTNRQRLVESASFCV